VVDDGAELMATVADLEAQAESQREELERGGELPRHFARNYFSGEDLRQQLLDARPLVLGFGDLYGKSASANTELARSFVPGPRYGGKTKEIARDLGNLHSEQQRIVLVTRQASRMQELLGERDIIAHVQSDVETAPTSGSVTLVQGVYGEGFVVRD
jgi:transcription-repair coupling factor (superfamily II helicase)